ncbi:5'-nucleotidase domain-containing protein 1 [Ameca splendens]|uniref:5'-nucleotidase domain-containing protein 1 n=1 Tax=Ameca splendens TaxID=208324 RepID=A0ABV0Y292_9TELE
MSEYFSLSDCDVVGFDLDHTLCRYHLKETSRLIYESFARYLVEHKGYDKDLLNLTPAIWDFCLGDYGLQAMKTKNPVSQKMSLY